MKKLLTIVAAAFIAASTYAATSAASITAAGVTNMVTGALSASSFILTSPANAATRVVLYDAPTVVLTNVVPSYITSGAYATNYITSYTNYFGVQNNFTNVALVHYSITNAASTNTYPILLTINAGTNETVVIADVTYNFTRGLSVSNAALGTASFSVVYTQ